MVLGKVLARSRNVKTNLSAFHYSNGLLCIVNPVTSGRIELYEEYLGTLAHELLTWRY